MILFTHGKKILGLKEVNLILPQGMMYFSPSRLTTIYPNKAAHYIPKGVKLA